MKRLVDTRKVLGGVYDIDYGNPSSIVTITFFINGVCNRESIRLPYLPFSLEKGSTLTLYYALGSPYSRIERIEKDGKSIEDVNHSFIAMTRLRG